MALDNCELVEKLKSVFKLKESPIAFFYTNNPPQDAYNPKRIKNIENIPCIIQFLNGVRSGRTLVLGKKSRNLCPGGLAYLGFKKIIKGLENFLSTGFPSSKEGDNFLEGERIKKTPKLAKTFLENIPFKKSPADFAVFMPLDQVNPEIYKPILVIFFVKMDQLAGLIQLANYDKINGNVLGVGSCCSTIITEPINEIGSDAVPRAVIGMLTDIIARRHIKSEEATFTIGYDRLIQLYKNIDESFLRLEAWKTISKRIIVNQ